MAELVKRDLVYRPELDDSSWRDLVKTIELGRARDRAGTTACSSSSSRGTASI